MSCLNLHFKELVADEGFEPPVRFCQTPAYETGEIGHFSNPLYLSGRRGSNPQPRPWQGRALPIAPLPHMKDE